MGRLLGGSVLWWQVQLPGPWIAVLISIAAEYLLARDRVFYPTTGRVLFRAVRTEPKILLNSASCYSVRSLSTGRRYALGLILGVCADVRLTMELRPRGAWMWALERTWTIWRCWGTGMNLDAERFRGLFM
jgi:hypothetical protein